MAMVTRSERGIDFSGKTTSSVVGPGCYDYQAVNQSKVRPNFASFGSSLSRNKKIDPSSIPGPGSYLDSNSNTLSVNNSNKYGSNAFTTTIARMAPMHPGATPFQNPSSVENPGPGTYELEPSVKSVGRSHQSSGGKQRGASKLLVAPSFNPPTVPSTLSKGPFVASRGFADISTTSVVSGSEVARTALQPKATPTVFSGIGEDKVGPCEYNPSKPSTNSHNAVNFSKSKPRELSLAVGGGKQDTPGPGTYVLPSSLNAVNKPPLQGLGGFNPGHSQSDAPNGRSSFFASSAPRVGIIGTGTSGDNGGLGPGSYVGTGGMGDSLMTDPVWIEKQYKQSASGFGSGSSHRGSFLGVSKQTKPGPGQYGTRSDFDFEPAYTLTGERSVGFGCSGARGCIPNAPEQVVRTSKSAPGPGDYDLENVNGLARGYDRVRRLGLGRSGVFGSGGERFREGGVKLPLELGGEGMQSPGAVGAGSYYDNQSDSSTLSHQNNIPKGSRLGGGAGGQGDVNGVSMMKPRHTGRLLRTHLGSYARLPLVTPEGTMVADHDLGGYSLKKSQDYKSLRDAPPTLSNHNPSSLETKGGVGVWSKTTEERFAEGTVMGRPIAHTPGPSRYQTNVSSFKIAKRNPNASVNSFSSGDRFQQPSALVNPNVGPGVYSTAPNWVKKSYNISYVPSKK